MPAIFKSRKFQAGIALTLTVFFGQLGSAIPVTDSLAQALSLTNWLEVMTPILTAIGAQGLADFGKEARRETKISPSRSLRKE